MVWPTGGWQDLMERILLFGRSNDSENSSPGSSRPKRRASSFERLPPEIRNQIYALVFPELQVIPFRLSDLKPKIIQTGTKRAAYREMQRLLHHRATGQILNLPAMPTVWYDGMDKMHGKSLLQVCRSIRQEAAFFMYQGHEAREFGFMNAPTLQTWVASIAPAFRAHLVQVLVWSGELSKGISRKDKKSLLEARKHLPNLKSLRLEIEVKDPTTVLDFKLISIQFAVEELVTRHTAIQIHINNCGSCSSSHARLHHRCLPCLHTGWMLEFSRHGKDATRQNISCLRGVRDWNPLVYLFICARLGQIYVEEKRENILNITREVLRAHSDGTCDRYGLEKHRRLGTFYELFCKSCRFCLRPCCCEGGCKKESTNHRGPQGSCRSNWKYQEVEEIEAMAKTLDSKSTKKQMR